MKYTGTDFVVDSATARRMPQPTSVSSPHVSPRPIVALVMGLNRFIGDEDAVRKEYPWATRFVMGLPLAPWQREFKWSEEQSRRFITSAWTGIPLGNYVLTSEDNLMPGNNIVYAPLANCVLEGQQRLRALELYFTDQLAVEDASGVLTKWSDIGRQERMRFERVIFNCGITLETDESKLRAFYDIMNFGGIAHEESERASAPSKAPISVSTSDAESASPPPKPAARRTRP